DPVPEYGKILPFVVVREALRPFRYNERLFHVARSVKILAECKNFPFIPWFDLLPVLLRNCDHPGSLHPVTPYLLLEEPLRVLLDLGVRMLGQLSSDTSDKWVHDETWARPWHQG